MFRENNHVFGNTLLDGGRTRVELANRKSVQIREKADKHWCTRTLRNKLVYVRVYGVTRLLAAAYTKHNIANSLVKKLLAIQSNKKQYCLKVTSQGLKPWTFRTEIYSSNITYPLVNQYIIRY